MLGSTGCFLYAMESLLVLRKRGGDVAITSPYFSAPLLRWHRLSLPGRSFAVCFLISCAWST
jgi:hypothetical protein